MNMLKLFVVGVYVLMGPVGIAAAFHKTQGYLGMQFTEQFPFQQRDRTFRYIEKTCVAI